MQNRRKFIKNVSAVSLGGMLAGRSELANAASTSIFSVNAPKKIGLQIYSLGKELYKDLPGGLKRISQMGYSTLELAGYKDGKINNVEMSEFHKMA